MPLFIAIAMALIAMVIKLVRTLPDIFRIIRLECAVTNKRVMGKTEAHGVKVIDFPIEKVDNIVYKATFWGKIFNFYTVTISGTGNGRHVMHGVTNAEELRNAVNQAIEMHAEEARMAQAAILAEGMRSANADKAEMRNETDSSAQQQPTPEEIAAAIAILSAIKQAENNDVTRTKTESDDKTE